MGRIPYRMKHKSSGLYYRPCGNGGNSLSKNGKIYTTKNNGVDCWTNDVHIVVNKKSKILSMEWAKKYCWNEDELDDRFLKCKMPKSDFVRENL